MISEREYINRILRLVNGRSGENLVKGIGDDCAVLDKDGENYLLLSTDTLVEGIHFDMAWHPPDLLGGKCASVNLSDIAAMGGRPHACLLSIGLPDREVDWFDDFIRGFAVVLNRFDTLLVGGDTVKSRHDLIVSVTVIGEGHRDRICYRHGARPGDLVWVSGPLGNAAAGLELCRRGLFQPEMRPGRWQRLVTAHLDPVPQIGLGMALAASGLVHAMMDISDGLATDLANLCQESGVGAELDRDRIPMEDVLKEAGIELGLQPLDWALKGGEDYQLLFTTGTGAGPQLQKLIAGKGGAGVCCIGRITGEPGVILDSGEGVRQEISYQGYDHFG